MKINLLTRKQAAKYAEVSEMTIRRWLKSDRINEYFIVSRALTQGRILPQELDEIKDKLR